MVAGGRGSVNVPECHGTVACMLYDPALPGSGHTRPTLCHRIGIR